MTLLTTAYWQSVKERLESGLVFLLRFFQLLIWWTWNLFSLFVAKTMTEIITEAHLPIYSVSENLYSSSLWNIFLIFRKK